MATGRQRRPCNMPRADAKLCCARRRYVRIIVRSVNVSVSRINFQGLVHCRAQAEYLVELHGLVIDYERRKERCDAILWVHVPSGQSSID